MEILQSGGKADRQDALRPHGMGRDLTFDLATSPLGLLLLHDLLALLSPALVDRVARVVDFESILILHVGILDFSALLIKLQNMAHPKSDRGGESSESSVRGYTKSPSHHQCMQRTVSL